jgi:NADH dehydrogenase
VRVTLIDRHNHHIFQPLLYQVATAALNASEIAAPIRRVLRREKNVEVFLAEAVAVDTGSRKVVLEDGEIPYDYLVVATGATHSYFGHDEWARFAPGLKSIEDAIEMRRRVFRAFEVAEREDDPERRKEWMTFVIVGAGPTGVELAGALMEIARHTLPSDFRRIDPRTARVILVEGTDRVLPAYVEPLSRKARAQLDKLGVEVRVKTRVTGIDELGVTIGEERIAARTVLWAAGVAASPLGRTLGVPLDRAGRVHVEKDLTLPGNERVYVIGDLASVSRDAGTVPGVAGAAVQAGRHAAENILRTMRGEPRMPFQYVDKGSLATIGRAAAVADFGRIKLSGFLAWLAWLFIHIMLLVGFRNRMLVFIQWAWSYVTLERGARLITEPQPCAETPATIPAPGAATALRPPPA